MTERSQSRAGLPRPALDAQILATWQALRTNPDLDARHAMEVIDRLLDQRCDPAEHGGHPAVRTRSEEPPGGVLAEIVATLATGTA